MGDRGQIKIRDTGVYLYTHWGGSELMADLKRALKRASDRWSDPEYLTRVIFDEMKDDDVTSTTGFGIGNAMHEDIEHPIPCINCAMKIVNIYNKDETALITTVTFNEFIKDAKEKPAKIGNQRGF